MRATRSTALAAAVVTAALAGGSLVSVGTAYADPTGGAAAGQLVGVGSDTTQDVLNALSKSVSVDGKSLASWDAVEPGTGSTTSTIKTRTTGKAFLRPNGSGAGRTALSDALAGQPYSDGTATGHVSITGQVDFARSSSGPSDNTSRALTYIPFARDAVSYAALGNGLQGLTVAQLQQIYKSKDHPVVINGITVNPKLPQANSGTRKFFLKALNLNASDVAWLDDTVNYPGHLVQENQADDALKNPGDLVPFSAASWVAQMNGTAPDHSRTAQQAGGYLGSIVLKDGSAAVAPVTVSSGVWSPNADFYSDPTFGRDVYNVVPTRAIDPTSAFYDDAVYKAFVTDGSHKAALASDTSLATIQSFGFLKVDYDGVLTSPHTLQGGLEDNALDKHVPTAPVVNSSAGNGSLGLSWSAGAGSVAPTDYRVTVTGPTGQVLKDKAGKAVLNEDFLPARTLTWSGLASGTYTVTVAAYNLNSLPGAGASVTRKIVVANRTATAISYSRALKVAYGYNERITAKVVPAGKAVPTGRVQLLDGLRVVGAGTLVKGVAVVNFLNPAYKPGVHSFTLKYLGDAANLASSTRVSFTIVKATPAERISFPTRVGHTKTSKIGVTLASPHATATGSVSIYDGRKRVGTAKVVNGKAVVAVAKLGKGTHKLRIVYTGNALLNATTRWVTVKSV